MLPKTFISSPRIYKRSPHQLFVHIPILNGHVLVYAECFCSGFELFWRWFKQISLRQKLAESKPNAWTYVFITNTRNTIWICRQKLIFFKILSERLPPSRSCISYPRLNTFGVYHMYMYVRSCNVHFLFSIYRRLSCLGFMYIVQQTDCSLLQFLLNVNPLRGILGQHWSWFFFEISTELLALRYQFWLFHLWFWVP